MFRKRNVEKSESSKIKIIHLLTYQTYSPIKPTHLIRAYPKVNLTLDILGRATCGYHYIDTILYEVHGDMFDEITIEDVDNVDRVDNVDNISDGIRITCDNQGIQLDRENSVRKTVDIMSRQHADQDEILRSKTKRHKGIHIHIKKGIPLESGLGGASADAAAVMKFLNVHWDLHLSEAQLRARAAEIGMDTPFFITGGIARATGFGEKIEPLNVPASTIATLEKNIVTLDTGIRVRTKDAYAGIDLAGCGKNTGKTYSLLRALKTGDIKNFAKHFHNDFDQQPALHGPYLTGSGGCGFTYASI